MKRINQILMSGNIVCKLGHTIQTEDSHVYSIDYHGKDAHGDYILIGYVQKKNTNHNAIVNGEHVHAFDVTLMSSEYQKQEYLL